VRSGNLAYEVDPAYRWLRAVRDGKKEYVKPGNEIAEKDRPAITVVREGPLAVCLRVRAKGDTSGHIDLTFPRSKSWVECEMSADDGKGELALYRVSLPLTLSGKKSLADFGAGSVVYTTLTKGQQAELIADDRDKQRWRVSTGDEGKLSPFVVPEPGSQALAEGWAHVMDADRCTALAVDRFGRGSRDVIRRQRLRRTGVAPPLGKG